MLQTHILHQNNDSIRFRITENHKTLSFRDVFELWQNNPEFVQFYQNVLSGLGFTAFCWEHPVLTLSLLDQKYECTLQKSALLDQLPVNEKAFKSHNLQEALAVDFLNLGKDARLVIPTKKSNKEIYNHFGKFLKFDQNQQVEAVFKKTGSTVVNELEKHPNIWLNTAGLGVIWLHIRMDTKPKYYKTKAYKNPKFWDKQT